MKIDETSTRTGGALPRHWWVEGIPRYSGPGHSGVLANAERGIDAFGYDQDVVG